MTAAVAPVGLVHAAKDCLAAPNGAVAQGQHWYYRVDRNTGQKCWYRDTAGHKIRTGVTAQAAHRSEPPAKPRPPSRETADDVVAAPARTESAQLRTEPAPPRAETVPPRMEAAQPAPEAAQPGAEQRAAWLTDPASVTTMAPTFSGAPRPSVMAPQPTINQSAMPTPMAASARVASADDPAIDGQNVDTAEEPASQQPDTAAAKTTATTATPAGATRTGTPFSMLFVVAVSALALAGLLLPFALKLAAARRRRVHVDPRAYAWNTKATHQRTDPPLGTPPGTRMRLLTEEPDVIDDTETLRKILRSLERHAA